MSFKTQGFLADAPTSGGGTSIIELATAGDRFTMDPAPTVGQIVALLDTFNAEIMGYLYQEFIGPDNNEEGWKPYGGNAIVDPSLTALDFGGRAQDFVDDAVALYDQGNGTYGMGILEGHLVNTRNATVSEEALIQPGHGFVAFFEAFNWASFDEIDAANLQLTKFRDESLIGRVHANSGMGLTNDFSGNCLSTEELDWILNFYATTVGLDYAGGTLKIEGQSPLASPTGGASNASIIALESNSWTVTYD